MDGSTLYEGEGFRLIKRAVVSEDSFPDWEYEGYSVLSDSLIADSQARGMFLDNYLKSNPPLLIIDPDNPFNEKLTFPRSGFFAEETIIIFRQNDTPEKVQLRELIKNLVSKNYLELDRYKIIQCECDEFSIGNGDASKKESFYCTKCRKPAFKGSKNKKVTKVFTFSPELKDLLYKWRGRILEGMIYRQCRTDEKINSRFNVVAYAQLQTIKNQNLPNEELETSEERDVVLIDRENKVPPIIILASISPSQTEEKRQIEKCSKLKLPTIFVCARGMSEKSSIVILASKIFDKVNYDKSFPASITNFIWQDIVPKYD